MELPPEVRNIVYEYALTSDRRLVYDCGGLHKAVGQHCCARKLRDGHIRATAPSFVAKNSKGAIEFNQLKYVSRKVREETKGLELKYNRIRFNLYRGRDPMPTFWHFVTCLSPSKLQWLRFVDIHQHLLDEPVENYIQIAEWCRRHPRATVRYISVWLPPPRQMRDEVAWERHEAPKLIRNSVFDFLWDMRRGRKSSQVLKKTRNEDAYLVNTIEGLGVIFIQ